MKRVQLIQIAILSVALISAYKAFETLVSIILSSIYSFSYGYGEWSGLPQFIILFGIYIASFVLLIKYNSSIASYIDKQDAARDNDVINVSIGTANLLYIVLVALCLITLISEIPVLILSIYNYFKMEAGGIRFGTPADLNFKIAAIKFTFTLILLFYAKRLANLFGQAAATELPLIKTPREL